MLTCIRKKYVERTEEQFLADRLLGFGGSDMGDLFDSEPYGCKRRLFLERLGLLPEDPDNKRAFHMERGKFLEGPIAELYQKRTKRHVKLTGSGYLKEYPFVRANADRLVWIDFTSGNEPANPKKNGWGVLEVKAPGQFAFKKIKKEGLPESYILQLQWQMLCYGTEWGSFAVYWADGHELITFDVERDNELCEMLFEKAKREWEILGEFKNDLARGNVWQHSRYLPPKKLETYTGCQNCPMAESCHEHGFVEGIVQDEPALEAPAENYAKISKMLKDLEAEKEELKNLFKQYLENNGAEKITAGKYNIYIREQGRESLDAKRVKDLLPKDKYEECLRVSKFQVLTVKEGKK